MRGVITKVFYHRGFGFISAQGRAKEVFFNMTCLDRYLLDVPQLSGRHVQFTLEEDRSGRPRAIRVRPLIPRHG